MTTRAASIAALYGPLVLRRELEQVESARLRATACGIARRAKLDLRPDC